MKSTHRGAGAVFCEKEKGHVERGDPEHKGFRKRWTDADPAGPVPLAAVAMVALREMSQEEREKEESNG
jgi:hypothetical protein